MAVLNKRPKKSEILKSKIFINALDLFMKKGFENVKISDICEVSDISIGTFYYYFPSKEAVLLDYYRMADKTADETAANLKCGSCAERLGQLVMQKVKGFSVAGQDMGNVCMTAFLKHRDVSSMDMRRSAYSHFMHAIEDGQKSGEFRTDLDPYMAASSLRYIIGGLAFHWVCYPDDFNLYEEAEKLIEHFVKAIKA
jgi:TetR/AcrR family fatty acid metabolism transcriptional regulator